jgi:magnesium-transporting ATPase (P-type)
VSETAPTITPPPGAACAGAPWHAVDPPVAMERSGSTGAGLTAAEARARLERDGPNELPRLEGESALAMLVRQVRQPLFYVLLGATVLAAVAGEPLDAAVILAVVVANVVIGFVQEHRASREVEAMLDLVADACDVVRDGRRATVPATDVVVGDLLALQAGQKVAADARVVAAHGLAVDEALLTGESVPVDKATAALPPGAALPERTNMVHAGTLVRAGSGRAVVTATGAGTELSHISALVAGADPLATPLTRKIAAFSRTVSVVIVVVAAAAFGVGLAWGREPTEAFLAAVALAVAAIPEGLPAIMTIALALGVRRMARRRAVVRSLPAVETLGSTTVICSDKTGTLTAGEMVATTVLAGEEVRISGIGHAPEGRFATAAGPLDAPPQPVVRALEAALLCSDARLAERDGALVPEGSPTEVALVVAAAKAGLDRAAAEARLPRLAELPFDSERKLMATLHRDGDGRRILVKGAPEAVLARASSAAWQERFDRQAIAAAVEGLAADGLRALAVAERRVGPAHDDLRAGDVDDDLHLLALAGLEDPPREEARDAVAACTAAGVRVVMVTGDHPRTATAIAARLGIGPAGAAARTATGPEIEALDDAALQALAGDLDVVARASPEHKLRLVRALQRRGEVVAVTGDGVNDAPALRQADIGVAMGVTGTDVSKEASDMVLRDDDFATIAAAVDEGRRVWDNLVKSIVFILPTNAGQALIVLGAVALGLTLPLTPVQVLWVNLVAAVTLALPLATEAREPDVMRRPPRRPDQPVLDATVVARIALVGAFMFVASVALFEFERARGAPVEEARTLVVALVMLVQAAYLFSCRSLRTSVRAVGLWSNPWIYAGVAAMVVLQLAFTYLPVMQTLFATAPLDADAWLRALGVALLVVPLVAAHKRLSRPA